MEEKTYKITLADGAVLDNLRLNGNNFIAKGDVSPDIFDGNCSTVIINDGTADDIHTNMELVQVTYPVAGESWIVLRDLSAAEIVQMQTRADIEYIAMMTGVEL
jgi:hypothetical protein